jgi:hypothetical protein
MRRKNLGVSLGALSELASILEPDSIANTSLHYLIHAAENHPGSEQFIAVIIVAEFDLLLFQTIIRGFARLLFPPLDRN